MSKPHRPRPPMSVNPALLASGGLAARGGSVAEQIQDNPEVSAKLDEWAKSPALRVAGSIGAEPAKQVESDVQPDQEAVQTSMQPVEAAQAAPEPVVAPVVAQPAVAASEPSAEPVSALDDDDDYQPIPAVRKARPWQDMERKVRDAVGIKGKNLPARVHAELYAKAWYLKETTAGMTWDLLVEEALTKHVNRKLKEMGYTP